MLFIVCAQLNGITYCCLTLIVLFATIKQFQALLSNVINSILYYSFVCTQFNGFYNSKLLNSSVWPINRTLTGTTTPVRVDLDVMAMKGFSTFLKAHHQMQFSVISRPPIGWVGPWPSTKMQSVYSTAPAKWAWQERRLCLKINICNINIYEVHAISFQIFFVWALLLIVHTWNSSPLRCNLFRLQCTCCTIPTTSGRPHGSPLVWACQWSSSQPLSSPHFCHNDSLWA